MGFRPGFQASGQARRDVSVLEDTQAMETEACEIFYGHH